MSVFPLPAIPSPWPRSRPRRAALGLALSSMIVPVAVRRGALTRDGAIAASVVGASVTLGGGIDWAIPMVGFFALSSALSALGRPRKATLADIVARGTQRDWAQVLANGGIATGLALLAAYQPRQFATLTVAELGAVAAAAADTWATELGALSPTPPRLLTTGHPVQPGTSGAVSLLGTIAGLAGASWVAGLGIRALPRPRRWSAVAVTLAGWTGMFIDSLLGATLQARRWCPVCQQPTEQRIHRCGSATHLQHGVSWLDNDLVNLVATATGALTALVANSLLRQR